MAKPIMSGIRLYLEAVIRRQHAGKLFLVQLVDKVDPMNKEYNAQHWFSVSDDFYAKKGNAIVIKGSNTNFLENKPRMIDAFMNGEVIDVVDKRGYS